MVAAGSSGFMVRLGCMPAATATIMVSPTAREIPRMYADAMPENAAGTTTLTAVWKRVAPVAEEPSRKLIGTARSESAERELAHVVGKKHLAALRERGYDCGRPVSSIVETG